VRRFALLLLPLLLAAFPDGLRRSQQQHRVVRRQGLRVLRQQAEGHGDEGTKPAKKLAVDVLATGDGPKGRQG
jgi:hypothetical protein